MVKIRLQRRGAKRRPFYRVVAIDERAKRDGRAIEFLGTYNPVVDPPEIRLDAERIETWRQSGAQLSEAVRGLLRRARRQPAAAPAEAPAPSPPPAQAAPEPAAPAGEEGA